MDLIVLPTSLLRLWRRLGYEIHCDQIRWRRRYRFARKKLLMIEKCPDCLTFSGRTNAGLECCRVRALAEAPKARMIAEAEKVRRESGGAAVDELRDQLAMEIQRKRDWCAAQKGES